MQERRAGLTKIELMVCLTIIGLLVAILIPAIQLSRENARTIICRNNLRQSGLAVQAFHSSHGHIPSLYNGSFIPHPRTQWDEYHFHSWQSALLPFLEQSALFQRLDQTAPATEPANQQNVNLQLPIFLCPSTSNCTPIVHDIARREPIEKVGTAARSDYEAIAGVFRPPETGGWGSGYNYIQLGLWGKPRYVDGDDGKFDGIYRTRFADVTDGLSNTIIIGEMAGRPDTYILGEPDQPYESVDGPAGQPAWAISSIFWANAIDQNHGVNDTNQRGLYSFHDSGVNVAMADGSARMLSNSTDRTVLHAMATKAGGETAAAD